MRPPAKARAYPRSGNSALRPSGEAAATPRSVTRPVTSRAGVTSKAGLAAGVPSGAMLFGLAMELVVTPLLCLWQSRLTPGHVDQ